MDVLGRKEMNNTIDLNGETITIEELSKAWAYYKEFLRVFKISVEEAIKGIEDERKGCVNVVWNPTFTPLTEPDPQG